jgi:hypothetical protein
MDLTQRVAALEQMLGERTAERDEALAREAAMAEVVQVINASPGNLPSVFDAIVEKAHTLCGAVCGSLQLWDGEKFSGVATAASRRRWWSHCGRATARGPITHAAS